jgi:EF hand domain-containing protein
MKKLLIGGGIAAFVVAIGPAMAQQAPPPAPRVFSQAAPAPVPPLPPQMHMMMMSGRAMTRDEVVRHVRGQFARLDANRDGYVTREEADSARSRMMGAMHAGIEQRLAGRGIGPDRAAVFDRLDANHDGNISRQEFMAAQPRLQERRAMIMHTRSDAAPGAPVTGMKMRMHGMAAGFGGRLFEMADANHDGRVSLAEAQQAALQHFDRADLNHDGTLSPEEREQAHRFMRQTRTN